MRIISIGRSKSATIRIDSEYVSARHAEILLMDNGDIFLTDCDSTQGTYLFGKRIEPWAEVPVRRGDKIEFDNVPLNWSRIPTLTLPDPATVKGIYGIGKSPRNRYQLSGDSVSRYHATFKEMKNGKWFIQDHSTNGTYINGQRIPSDQDVRITAKDQIICGTVPCVNPLASSSSSFPKSILIALASMAACVALFFGIRAIIGSRMDPSRATVYIYEDFVLKVVFADDPAKARFGIDWYVGCDAETGEYDLVPTKEDAAVMSLEGTGFFVSREGHIITNKHVTNWIWADKQYDNGRNSQGIRNGIERARNNIAPLVATFLGWSLDEAEAYYNRMLKTPFELEVVPLRYCIGYAGRDYTDHTDMSRASRIDEDDKYDLAILQLDSKETPSRADYFRINRTITDVTKLSMTKQYNTIGFPAGLQLTKVVTKDKIQATRGLLHLIQEPSNAKLLFQGDLSVGGQSGSPIYDSNHRLIAVLYGGYTHNESTTACPIVHAVELLKRNLISY